jgi:pyruvate carboxylase
MSDNVIRPIKKILIANRSEIAIRVMRAATELGISTVAIYAYEDRFCPHRFKADEAYQLDQIKGPLGAYLDIEGIIALALEKGVDAIHPGYGFLSENPEFARACEKNGLLFIGPNAEVLDRMGDKTAARAVAEKLKIPTLQGTENAIEDPEEAVEAAKKIGFPLIIKAAFGGGGRGMRVVKEEKDLVSLLNEAQTEAQRSFGNGAVFLERFVGRAKHIEVQILADKQGNVLHLHERDCSVQRRHQKVIEMAPSYGIDQKIIEGLCAASIKIAREVNYTHAGTVEFLVDIDAGEWYFIEMNPRIQVEHTVTEEITTIDIVQCQIQIAKGYSLHDEPMSLPKQEKVEKSGFAIQCRITTEDPENNFTPDFGKIFTYRSAGGFGVRLDGALGTQNAVITPYYDSMLVKVTVFGRSYKIALDRMDRSLREFRIRGVKTNIPFLENVIADKTFRAGDATTRFIDNNPQLFTFPSKKDRATKLLSYIADTTVNGNPNAKNYKPKYVLLPAPAVIFDHIVKPAEGTKNLLTKLGPEKFAAWITEQKQLLLTDTTMRDAHQSLLATRVRSFDMLAIADTITHRTPNIFSLEMWGGATFDTAMRFLHECPWERLRMLREKIPNICFQMLFRGSNAVGYTNYPDNVVQGFIKHAAESGMDIFRIFDSLNYLPNLAVAMTAVREQTSSLCEGTICYTGDILDPKRDKYDLRYYVNLAKELEKMGAHILCIKDMAGLCRPLAAKKLVTALKEEIGLPIHFHTHDTSGINSSSILMAAEAGVDICDTAIASMSGCTSQPNLNSIVASLQHSERNTKLDLNALNDISDYWGHVRSFYKPFDTAEPYGTAEVYLHEMPGGQYTNLKEQAESMGIGHRWHEIAKMYAEVNILFGDIVKVTPSSKVVGDMCMFLISRGVKSGDAHHYLHSLPAGTNFPESVIDMLQGGLGQPIGGWPSDIQKIILGNKMPFTNRPGERAEKIDLEISRTEAAKITGNKYATDDDLYSYLMYPQVFRDFTKFSKKFGNLSVLPTPTFFYGIKEKEEITISLEAGKTLFIRLHNFTDPDGAGMRTAIFDLNGYPRHLQIEDKHVAKEKSITRKADTTDLCQIGAPMPGMVASIAKNIGMKVKEGESILILEAMKMFTTITAPCDGIIAEILLEVGATVESKDLMVRLTK